MIPQELLDLVEREIEYDTKSCLTCMHFQTRNSAKVVQCDVRPRIKHFTKAFGDIEAGKAQTRGTQCEHYTGEAK